jgi:biotin transport system substrate-specific component
MIRETAFRLAKKELITSKPVISAMGIITFALLTWIGAYIYIPLGFTPVPLTLQTFFVFLSGAFLGKRLGAASQTAYLALGSLGMPLFSASGFGILHLAGPTGGYIFGFIAASFIIGGMTHIKSGMHEIILAFISGACVIFAFGAGWLVVGFGLTIKQALALGVLPFLPGCVIKIAAAALITKACFKRTREIFS